EDYEWWADQLGQPMAPGTFGENLTVAGLALGALVIGTRVAVGTAVLEVAQPRLPCFKLGMRMGDADFVDRFEDAERFGAYLRIVEEGDVGAGDDIEIVHDRTDGVTVGALGRAMHGAAPDFLRRLVDDA